MTEARFETFTVNRVELSESQVAAIFAEWERRRRADPESFRTEADIAAMNPEDHGAESAAFFIRVGCELAAEGRL